MRSAKTKTEQMAEQAFLKDKEKTILRQKKQPSSVWIISHQSLEHRKTKYQTPSPIESN